MLDRHDRVVSIITEQAATFIRNESNTSPLITVTRADVSSDLKNAIIFFTAYPESEEGQALAFLKRKGAEFRQYVANRTRLKRIPFFAFVVDHGEKNRQRLDEIAGE